MKLFLAGGALLAVSLAIANPSAAKPRARIHVAPRALAAAPDGPGSLRGRALIGLAHMTYFQGHYVEAAAWVEGLATTPLSLFVNGPKFGYASWEVGHILSLV